MKIYNNLTQFNNYSNTDKRYKNQNKQNPSFTGWFDVALRFLDTNQAWGANAVDFGCMVLPRSITDFGRGSEAGWETARRESMGTINDSSVGVYGTLAGLALATGINKAFDFRDNELKVSSVFADSETIDMMGEIWHKKLDKNVKDPLLAKIEESLANYEVFKDGKWVPFDKVDIKKAANLIKNEVISLDKKLGDITAYNIEKILTSSNSRENNYRIISKTGKEHTSRYTVKAIVENTYKLSKLFSKDEIKATFENATKVSENVFLKQLKNMNRSRSLWGVGIATAVGMSTQPINMYLTKRKTGKDNFVGGGEKDKSIKFKFEKLFVTLAFGAGVLASIGDPRNLIKHLQFKGFTPTLKQLKFIYGLTIMSRFLAARNENELKEASIKDILGFTNWLILGNFVQKLVAQALDKSLIKQEKVGGMLNWINTSSLKTRDEVLHETLGNNAFKNKKALSFNEMLKAVSRNSAAKKKLGILTLAQLSGYLYSGLVLGVGIPKLNIYLTKRRMAKQSAQQQNTDKTLSKENINFLREFTGNTIKERMYM